MEESEGKVTEERREQRKVCLRKTGGGNAL